MKGEPAIGGLRGPDAHDYFCPHCMTWMFTRPGGMPFVTVGPTMLDDASWFRPYMETFASTRLAFAGRARWGVLRSFPETRALRGWRRNIGGGQLTRHLVGRLLHPLAYGAQSYRNPVSCAYIWPGPVLYAAFMEANDSQFAAVFVENRGA